RGSHRDRARRTGARDDGGNGSPLHRDLQGARIPLRHARSGRLPAGLAERCALSDVFADGAEPGVARNRREIAVAVPHRDVVVDRDCRDKTVHSRSDRIAAPAAASIDGSAFEQQGEWERVTETWNPKQALTEKAQQVLIREALRYFLNHWSANHYVRQTP